MFLIIFGAFFLIYKDKSSLILKLLQIFIFNVILRSYQICMVWEQVGCRLWCAVWVHAYLRFRFWRSSNWLEHCKRILIKGLWNFECSDRWENNSSLSAICANPRYLLHVSNILFKKPLNCFLVKCANETLGNVSQFDARRVGRGAFAFG